ncbi:MAG: glycoside hydrolase family 43 protein [Anaerolineae bacterium]|nr:MAG: glycoside hydrolase family 43 protein [Anaerolineae bacterium]
MTHYRNPILPGFYPDPSICRVGQDYYLVTSTFEYFPSIPVFHSKDLIHWRQVSHAVSRSHEIDLSRAHSLGGLYAPTIRYHQGWFYIVSTNVLDGGHFLVKTQDPAGEWSAPLWIELPTRHAMTFDPSLFFDDDGQVYFTCFTSDGIMQALIEPDSGRLLTPPRRIADSMNGFTSEGPHLYKINGTYYLMTAEGGTEYGHMVSIYRASNPWGPFEPYPRNPILSHRSLHSPIQITGHGDLTQDPQGQWWMVFLGVRVNGYQPVHHLGRETFLAPVYWQEDGWPRVAKVELEMDAPLPAVHPSSCLPVRDDFDSPQLALYWNFIRNPEPESWCLRHRPGFLCLHGLPGNLSSIQPTAFVGRRQQHFEVQVRALIEFSPQGENEEAGLCIRMNEQHHYEIFLTRRSGATCLVVRRTIGTLSAETACVPVPASPLIVSIHADRDWYVLGWEQGEAFHPLDRAETRYLSSEVARSFTGVYFGMYATGNGAFCAQPAFFDWFDYLPQSH